MTQIIAFTQTAKLGDVKYRKDELDVFFETKMFSKETPFLIITKKGIEFKNSISGSNDTIAIIAYDYYNENDINNDDAIYLEIKELIKNLNSECLKIKHSNMHPLIKNITTTTEWKLGYHITANTEYSAIIDLILDVHNNTSLAKTNLSIVEEVKKRFVDASLLAKLKLLHEIYEGKDYSNTAEDKNLEKFSDKITDFKAKVPDTYKNDDKGHRGALIELRDALMADI